MGRKGAETGLERRWNGAGKGYFMADKKPRKCLSAPQVFIRPASLFRTNRVCLRHPRFYPCRTPFPLYQPFGLYFAGVDPCIAKIDEKCFAGAFLVDGFHISKSAYRLGKCGHKF